MGIIQNTCITLMKGFDPLQMLTSMGFHRESVILHLDSSSGHTGFNQKSADHKRLTPLMPSATSFCLQLEQERNSNKEHISWWCPATAGWTPPLT